MGISKKIFVSVFAIMLFNPVMTYAQSGVSTTLPQYNAGVDQSISDYLCTPSQPADGHDLERCVNRLYRFSVTVAALIVVFFIVLAGYLYITGGETGKTKGKTMLFNALTGLGIILCSYMLLYFINPSLVVIKSIQPPIFEASALPTCDQIGFEDDCLLSDGSTVTGASTGFGEKIPCPSGQIVSAKGLGLPTKQADEKICKPFGEKLLGLKTSLSGLSWRITDTIGDGHESKCHATDGNPYAGTCADIGYETNDRSTANWNKLCAALLAIGQLQPVNEADGKANSCPKYGTYVNTTGAHIHVNWRSGGGSSSTSTSSTTGSKPYCRAVHGFLCDHPAGFATNFPSYSPSNKATYTSSDPTIQANLTKVLAAVKELQKKHPSVGIVQFYRPHEYGAHMRSVFEAGALRKGWTESQVKARGFYCDGSIQYVKNSDLVNLSADAAKYIDAHWIAHGMSLSSSYDSTCLSEHGFGYAVDLSSSNTKAIEKDADAVGLCHNLPGDTNHYVLKEKNKNNKGCSWATN